MPKELDSDPVETAEWLDAVDSVIAREGRGRAVYLLEELIGRLRKAGTDLPFSANTPYVNTIGLADQPPRPTDFDLAEKISAYTRWNAMAIVLRANRESTELGGHISSYASAATLYDIGLNYFWRAPGSGNGGDLIFSQGHSSPGIYARAFLEGRLSEEQLSRYRQEVGGGGLPSYPHPWLLPDFWQFPTVSMGLGPLMAIYQARFLRYLHDRDLADASNRNVWAFMGDGEMDEPESKGAIALAAREGLDNLIFVVNCNLQRLDGPVRGNGKIIQELEGFFRGAGWNVIKVIWGSNWDPLLARDADGRLAQIMDECMDGDYQTFKSKDGAYVRKAFFGRTPETLKLVQDMTDAEIWGLARGGHDAMKVFSAYQAAVLHKGQPTVILAKTIKGYGMGESMEALNVAHQAKKLDAAAIRKFRDRFKIPIPDEQLAEIPFAKPPPGSPEAQWLEKTRTALGGGLPSRRRKAEPLQIPPLSAFAPLLSAQERELSTTMAFVRALQIVLRDKNVGRRVVPIVADEARTFGMEGMFRQVGIYSPVGQLYHAEDEGQLMAYKEDIKGQMLEEGINEAGAMSSWIAAATSYSTHGVPMIPFYIFYSMFGFQRVGDLAWAAGDMRARGFLVGGTSGRTTLNGEGLQHEDGHSHLVASTIPNCVAYDPAYAYELAVILQDGLRRMYVEQEDVYYYLTVMNENWTHPALPQGAESSILRGIYRLRAAPEGKGPRVRLLGSGAILREVLAAADWLLEVEGVRADVYSVTSYTELRRDGLSCERWSALHPEAAPPPAGHTAAPASPRTPWVTECLSSGQGPIVAASDYMKLHADQIRPFIQNGRFRALGTDGFGRSDYRKQLRAFFEVDRRHVAFHALSLLADEGAIPRSRVLAAMTKLGIDPEKIDPVRA